MVTMLVKVVIKNMTHDTSKCFSLFVFATNQWINKHSASLEISDHFYKYFDNDIHYANHLLNKSEFITHLHIYGLFSIVYMFISLLPTLSPLCSVSRFARCAVSPPATRGTRPPGRVRSRPSTPCSRRPSPSAAARSPGSRSCWSSSTWGDSGAGSSTG